MQSGTYSNGTGTRRSRSLRLATCGALLALLVACGESGSPAQQPGQSSTLPVSLNDVMVAMVNKATDPAWTGRWNNPQTDEDWRELEHLAFQVQVGGGLMQQAGTGPRDAEWAADPEWQRLAAQLQQDGIRAVNAVRSRNLELMQRAGGQLIETCESCHREFATDLPTLDQVNRPRVSL